MANRNNSLLRRMFPTCHRKLLKLMLARTLPPLEGRVLVVGSGYDTDVALVSNAGAVVRVDLDACDGNTCVIGDAHSLPFADNSFDCVLAFEVFEHLKDGRKAATEIYRVLSEGGHCCVSIPFLFPIHGDPDDYVRYTNSGIIELFCEFDPQGVVRFGSLFHVIFDLLTIRFKGFVFLRLFNHFLCLFGMASKNNNFPSGIIAWFSK